MFVLSGLSAFYYFNEIKIDRDETGGSGVYKINSGFNKAETEELFQAVKQQKNIERSEIIRIIKISENEADIQTGFQKNPLNGQGSYYIFKKVDGNWIFQREGAWIS